MVQSIAAIATDLLRLIHLRGWAPLAELSEIMTLAIGHSSMVELN